MATTFSKAAITIDIPMIPTFDIGIMKIVIAPIASAFFGSSSSRRTIGPARVETIVGIDGTGLGFFVFFLFLGVGIG